jgi:hypothetical protein
VFERFTDQSRRVLVLAQEEARLLDHSFIGTEHLLLGLTQEGVPAQVLAGFDISLAAVREQAAQTIGLSGTPPTGSPPFTPRAKKVLELSLRSALQLGDQEIGPEHILLGLIQEGEGVGAQILVQLGAELAQVRQRVIQLLSESHGGLGDRLSYHPELPPELRRQSSSPTVRAPRLWHQGKLVTCSFCGLAPPESGQLVAGDNAFICEHCVRQWSRQLTSSGPFSTGPFRTGRFRRMSVADVLPGPQPENPDGARAEISAAYSNHGTVSEDGLSLPWVEDGENLGPTLAAAKDQRPDVAEVVISIDDLVFVDIEHAALLFSISVNGGPVLTHYRGDAVLIDGVWKMARSTFCQLMAMGGIQCPPERE